MNFKMPKKRILIIEDEKDVSQPLAFRLKKYGFQVLVASDGQLGLEAIQHQKPDLIILDLFLPHISGEEICKTVREHDNEEIEKIPIIMLTAKRSDADRVLGKVIGANAYLTKPYDPKILLQEINHWLLKPSLNGCHG